MEYRTTKMGTPHQTKQLLCTHILIFTKRYHRRNLHSIVCKCTDCEYKCRTRVSNRRSTHALHTHPDTSHCLTQYYVDIHHKTALHDRTTLRKIKPTVLYIVYAALYCYKTQYLPYRYNNYQVATIIVIFIQYRRHFPF